MKFLGLWFVFLGVYMITAFAEIDKYSRGFDALDRKFSSASSNRQADCYLKAMREHTAGYDDMNLVWPPSWFEVNRRQFGKECEAVQ
jgi:hypothetical protein